MKIYIVIELYENDSCIREAFTDKRKANKYMKACVKETGNQHQIIEREISE